MSEIKSNPNAQLTASDLYKIYRVARQRARAISNDLTRLANDDSYSFELRMTIISSMGIAIGMILIAGLKTAWDITIFANSIPGYGYIAAAIAVIGTTIMVVKRFPSSMDQLASSMTILIDVILLLNNSEWRASERAKDVETSS